MSPEDMTLGQAIDWLNVPPFGCACIGDAYCCLRRTQQAWALQRGAHIVAKQLADLVHRAEEHTEVCQ